MSEVGVLDKVVAVLHAFPDGVTRLDAPGVAERLEISQPTAYRLMKAMAEHQLLERDAGGFRLGVTLLHWGSRVADGLDVRHAAHIHMEWLREQTEENAELHLRHGHTRVPIDVVASRLNLRPMGQVGVPFPIHVGASSKVLLAWLDEDEADSLAAESAVSDPDHPFHPGELRASLAETRERGWAVSDGEREVGVASVAAPVRDRFGVVVAALVVAAPSARLMRPDSLEQSVTAVNEAAHRVSHDLGHVGSHGWEGKR